MELDDLTLVRRSKEGDQRAFRILVERYQRKVFSVAFGMVKDHEEALDIAQEAFVKVHRYLQDFKGDSSFYTWLYRITRNLAVDRLRSRRSQAAAFDERVDGTRSSWGRRESSPPGWERTRTRPPCGGSWRRSSRKRCGNSRRSTGKSCFCARWRA